MTLVVLLVSPFAGKIVTRTGVRTPLVLGSALTPIGLLHLAMVDLTGSYLTEVLPGPTTVALGNGIAFAPTMIAATSGVGEEEHGLASGLLSTSQELGTAVGLATLAAIAAAGTRASQLPEMAAATGGYRLGYVGAAALAGVATLVATRAPRWLGRGGAVVPGPTLEAATSAS